jgi:hypothetical protein
MTESRKRESREVWAKRVERWKDSDLSANEFAAEVGVNPRTLVWWRTELKRSAARAAGKEVPAKRMQASTERSATRSTGPGPVKTRHAHAVASVVQVSGGSADRLEVVFGSGVTLRIPERFDVDAVGRLVTLLREAS